MPEQQDQQLSRLLQSWREESPLPLRFGESVWLRIEKVDVPQATAARLFRAWIDRTFARPAVALAYCAVLLAAGLGLGLKQGSDRSARADAQLEARYVQAISPYHKVNP